MSSNHLHKRINSSSSERKNVYFWFDCNRLHPQVPIRFDQSGNLGLFLCVSASHPSHHNLIRFFSQTWTHLKCVAEEKSNIYPAHHLIGTAHLSNPVYFLAIFVTVCLFRKMASPESFTRFAFVGGDPPIVCLNETVWVDAETLSCCRRGPDGPDLLWFWLNIKGFLFMRACLPLSLRLMLWICP